MVSVIKQIFTENYKLQSNCKRAQCKQQIKDEVSYYKYRSQLHSVVNELSGRHEQLKKITDVLHTVAVSFLRNWDVPLWKEYSGMGKIVRYQAWWLFEMAGTVEISEEGIIKFEIDMDDLGFNAAKLGNKANYQRTSDPLAVTLDEGIIDQVIKQRERKVGCQ